MLQVTDSDRMEAGTLFRVPPRRLGCAESVVELTGHRELTEAMGRCNGGRAPEGLCGALWGAMQAVPESRREALRSEFRESLGYEACRDLKSLGKVPCLDCVAMGLALVRKHSESL